MTSDGAAMQDAAGVRPGKSAETEGLLRTALHAVRAFQAVAVGHQTRLPVRAGVDLHPAHFFACPAVGTGLVDLEDHPAPAQPVGHGAHGTKHAPDALVIHDAKDCSHHCGHGEDHDKGFAHFVKITPDRGELDGQHNHQEDQPT